MQQLVLRLVQTKPIVKLMKLWLLLKKHNRLLTKLTSALCVCWKKLAASNSPSGLLSSRSIFWIGFFIAWDFPLTIKNPSTPAGLDGLLF
ncbi:hypothetical protein BK640_22900 [Pseudomonas protegens]|nr:hypothetical protein A1395_12725 [Pseudomonas protegens]PNG37609.1 hypothetical protein A1348_04190 [Pseudomonas protegens]ROL93967.1 hypothetical protein BK639_15720 [Pseudomonas protegens]ROL97192.1 hypothetical protein BK640_22900 [Pseudomonas protegens]ROM00137.1 hypothetical protein BK641_25680 [Pseudomonas protegens]